MSAVLVVATVFAAVLGIFLFVTVQYGNKYTEGFGLRTQILVAATVTVGCIALTLAGAAGDPARRQLQTAMGLSPIVTTEY